MYEVVAADFVGDGSTEDSIYWVIGTHAMCAEVTSGTGASFLNIAMSPRTARSAISHGDIDFHLYKPEDSTRLKRLLVLHKRIADMKAKAKAEPVTPPDLDPVLHWAVYLSEEAARRKDPADPVFNVAATKSKMGAIACQFRIKPLMFCSLTGRAELIDQAHIRFTLPDDFAALRDAVLAARGAT